MKTLLASLVIGSFATAPSFAAEDLPMETLAHGQYGNLSLQVFDPAGYVVDDDATWNELWTELNASVSPAPDRPSVDFATKTVLGLATSKSTGGYELTIDRVTQDEDVTRVYATLSAPGNHCMVTMAETQPHHIVAVPKISGTVEFELEQKQLDCD